MADPAPPLTAAELDACAKLKESVDFAAFRFNGYGLQASAQGKKNAPNVR